MIYCVEDEPAIQRLIAAFLKSDHLEAQFFSDGRSAIRSLERTEIQVDLLLADLGLPDISGFFVVEAAKRLRPRLPVVVVTAYAPSDIREEIDDLVILGKPFDRVQLVDAIRFATLLAETKEMKTLSNAKRLHERRHSMCHPTKANVTVKAITPSMQWAETVAEMLDLSDRGIRLAVHFAMPLGSEVMVALTSGMLYGTVRNCQAIADGFRVSVSIGQILRSSGSAAQ